MNIIPTFSARTDLSISEVTFLGHTKFQEFERVMEGSTQSGKMNEFP
jgi:hypothetical protein